MTEPAPSMTPATDIAGLVADNREFVPASHPYARIANVLALHARATAAEAALAKAVGIVDLARELLSPAGLVNRGVDRGLVVVESADKSDPHYRLCAALDAFDRTTLAALRERDGSEGVS